jgi:anti-sigma factor RsiW
MECRQVQELLKSDYLDGQIRERDGKIVMDHLASCAACRQMENELRLQRDFFQKNLQRPVPERVWQKIQNAVVMENMRQDERLGSNVRFSRRLFFFPRPSVFVLASSLAVVFLIAFLAVTTNQEKQYIATEGGLEIIAGYNLNGSSDNLITDLGTSIEQYFL